MTSSIVRNLRIFASSQKYKWLANLFYRTQTVAWLIIVALSTLTGIISISVIYSISSGIEGWSYFQILALSGLASAALGVALYFIDPYNLVTNMRNGVFDQVLTKPYNPVLLAVSRFGGVGSLGSIVSGLSLAAYAIANTQVSAAALAFAAVIFALGCLTLVMFITFISVLSYVAFKGAGYLNRITKIAGETSGYPLVIYGTAGLLLLTVGLPIGIATFYPAELIFLKIDYVSALGVAAIAVLLSYLFYRGSLWLLRFYSSGGG